MNRWILLAALILGLAATPILSGCVNDTTSEPATATTTNVPVPAAPATPPTTPSPSDCPPGVEVLSELPTEPIVGKDGIQLTVSVTCLKAGQSVWMLDHTDRYYMTYPTPIATEDGIRNVFDGPLGSGNEVVTVKFVVCDEEASRWLGNLMPNAEGDSAFTKLPEGAYTVAEIHVPVKKG